MEVYFGRNGFFILESFFRKSALIFLDNFSLQQYKSDRGEFQEKILSKGAASLEKPLSHFLQDSELDAEDKVRLFIIYLLTRQSNDEQQGGLSSAEIDSYCAELEAAGCDTRPVAYIRKWISVNSMSGGIASKSKQLYTGGGNIGSAKMFSNLLSQGSQFVMEGVKNFVLTHRVSVSTRMNTNSRYEYIA